MFGIDDAALAGLAGSAISGGLQLFGQGQQQQNQQQAMAIAQQNYLLQQRGLQQQYELSTAGREDARGNKTTYTPGLGWHTEVTPETKGLITSSDAAQRQNTVTDITRGQGERSLNFDRRLQEGSTAGSMLSALQNRYGAPSREGVAGANKIAGVTGANEAADNMKSGLAAAALRSGGSTMPLAQNFAAIDRGAVQGGRSAAAQADVSSPGMYEGQLQNYTKGLSDPYNMLATRASNTDGVPFAPENVSAGVDAGLNSAAGIGQQTYARGLPGTQSGANSMMAALYAQKQPDYGTFAGGISSNLKQLMAGLNSRGTNNNITGSIEDATRGYM